MKKIIIRVVLCLVAVLVILSAVLAVHIYQVTRPSGNNHTNWQLARVDFNTPMDSVEAKTIRSYFYQIEGVKQAYVNAKEGNVVYAYTPGTLEQETVNTHLKSKTELPFEFYVANASGAEACPVINKKSPMYRLGLMFRNLFS